MSSSDQPSSQSPTPPPVPRTLHELLALAITDLEAAQENPDYHIDMGVWHTKSRMITSCANDLMTMQLKCTICLAGAVMANTLKLPQCVHVDGLVALQGWLCDEGYDAAWSKAISAINQLRLGNVAMAYTIFYGCEFDATLHSPFLYITEYDVSSFDFLEDMKDMQLSLQAAGI